MVRRSWWRVWGSLAIAAWVTPAWGQTPGGRPPDLFVTRLQGARPAGAAAETPPSRPGDVSPLLLTELDDRQRGADLDGPRRVSLNVTRPMPLGELLLLLVNGTPLSLVIDNDVTGTFVGDLKDLTMRQALEAVLFPRGLDYDVQGTLVRVFPRKAVTRLFTVKSVNERRTLQRDVRTPSSIGSGNKVATQLSSVTSTDLFDEIEKGIQSLLSASGRMHVDRAAGLVQVTDFSERLDQVGVYVEAAQLRASRQVRIDAQVFTVALAPGAAGSIDWSAQAIRSGAVSRPSAGNGPGGLAVTNIDALTRALAEQGVVTKLAAPQIVAMNNEPAVMRVGRELVYFESAAVSRAGGDQRTMSPATVLEGLTLTVVAQIAADNVVQLHVSPAYSSQSGQSKARDGTVVPLLTVNEADTLMRVRDGETIVLAGFVSSAERSKPATGMARFFAAESHTTVTSELVILLTPTILRSAGASPN
jgi:MSHA biogenesis protein MshL